MYTIMNKSNEKIKKTKKKNLIKNNLTKNNLTKNNLTKNNLTKKLIKNEYLNKIKNDSYNLNNYKIIKYIKNGQVGSVYLIENNTTHKQYAYKIGKIPEELYKKEFNILYIINKFKNDVIKKYPYLFMKIYEIGIINNCKYIQDTYNIYERSSYINSNYCVYSIMSLVNGSLNSIYYTLNNIQKISFLIQFFLILKILKINMYIHTDIHVANICFIKSNLKFIKVLDYKIPIYGYIYQLIDYDSISIINNRNNNNINNNIKKNIINIYIILIKLMIINKDKFLKYVNDNKINIDNYYIKKKIYSTKKYNLIKKYFYLNCDSYFYRKIQNINLYNLYQIFYLEDYQKIVLGRHFKNVIPYEFYLNIKDFKHIIYNISNHDKVIKYLFNLFNK